jgi:hypothetical protein
MEGKGPLSITLGSRKYPWFHTIPWFYTPKEKLRNIPDVSPMSHSGFCNKSSKDQGFDKMQTNQGVT